MLGTHKSTSSSSCVGCVVGALLAAVVKGADDPFCVFHMAEFYGNCVLLSVYLKYCDQPVSGDPPPCVELQTIAVVVSYTRLNKNANFLCVILYCFLPSNGVLYVGIRGNDICCSCQIVSLMGLVER